MDDVETRVDMTATMLRGAAIAAGMIVTGDERVSEAACATLLGLEVETLAKKRAEGRAPTVYRIGVDGSRFGAASRGVTAPAWRRPSRGHVWASLNCDRRDTPLVGKPG